MKWQWPYFPTYTNENQLSTGTAILLAKYNFEIKVIKLTTELKKWGRKLATLDLRGISITRRNWFCGTELNQQSAENPPAATIIFKNIDVSSKFSRSKKTSNYPGTRHENRCLATKSQISCKKWHSSVYKINHHPGGNSLLTGAVNKITSKLISVASH